MISLITAPFNRGQEHFRSFNREPELNGRAVVHFVAGVLETIPVIGHLVYIIDWLASACLSAPQPAPRPISPARVNHRRAGPNAQSLVLFGRRNQFNRGANEACTVHTFEFLKEVFMGSRMNGNSVDQIIESGVNSYASLTRTLRAKRQTDAYVLIQKNVPATEETKGRVIAFVKQQNIRMIDIINFCTQHGLGEDIQRSLLQSLSGDATSVVDVERSDIFAGHMRFVDIDVASFDKWGQPLPNDVKYNAFFPALERLSDEYRHAGASINVGGYSIGISVSKGENGGYIYRVFDPHGSNPLNQRPEAFIYNTRDRRDAVRVSSILSQDSNDMEWRVYVL